MVCKKRFTTFEIFVSDVEGRGNPIASVLAAARLAHGKINVAIEAMHIAQGTLSASVRVHDAVQTAETERSAK